MNIKIKTVSDITKNLSEGEREKHKELIKECLERERMLFVTIKGQVENLKKLQNIFKEILG